MTKSSHRVPSEFHLRELWAPAPNRFRAAMADGPGFSVQLGDELHRAEQLAKWTPAQSGGDLTLRHPSGLVATRKTRVLDEGRAVEFQIIFHNTSTQRSPAISNVKFLDLALRGPTSAGNCVISSGGGFANGYFPSHAYRLNKSYFTPYTPDAAPWPRVLGSNGGRSADKDLPFFFVHNDELGEGLFVGIAWSGQWSAKVTPDALYARLDVEASIPDLNIELEPGETIEGPVMLVGLYTGDEHEGANRLRQLIRQEYQPTLNGKPFECVPAYCHYWNIGMDFNVPMLLDLARVAAEVGQRYFILDAGWFEGIEEGCKIEDAHPWYDQNFGWGLGNWYQVNKIRFPQGLPHFADQIRALGLKFALWFEPERVCEGTALATEHPDWILWDRTDANTPTAKMFGSSKGRKIGTLYLGNPAACDWVYGVLEHYIRTCGAEYLKWDMNFDMLPYWNAADAPNRAGIHQLRHIQGLYSIFDRLKKEHPGVVIETCAGGGYRVDLGLVRRSHTIWINDYTVDPSIIRYHLHGLNSFLPASYQYVQYTHPSRVQPNFEADDVGFQSLFGGSFGTGGLLTRWTETTKARAKRHVAVYEGLREFLDKEYYPLTAQPIDLSSWSGWQFHDREKQAGFFQTFRDKSLANAYSFALRGLRESGQYIFMDCYGAEQFKLSGAQAMAGIEVKQDKMTSRVFRYRLET